MENIHKLLSVLATIQDHGEPAAAEWFSKGCRQYLTGEQNTLDRALFSSTAGRIKARTLWARQERNRLIRQAMTFIDPDQGPTRRCDLLAKEITSFENRIYPRWAHLETPPTGCSKLRKVLFFAKKTGEPLPSGWRPVYRCVFGY